MTIVYRLLFSLRFIYSYSYLTTWAPLFLELEGRAGREGGVSELRGHTFASQFECHTVTTHKNSPTFKPHHFTPTILCKKTHTTHLTSRCWLLVNHGDQVRNFKSPQVSRFPITSCRKIKRFLWADFYQIYHIFN